MGMRRSAQTPRCLRPICPQPEVLLPGSGFRKGDGSGGFAAAVAGIDYVLPSGDVATATALAAVLAKCCASSYPLGVDTRGNAVNDPAVGGSAVIGTAWQGCFHPWGGLSNPSAIPFGLDAAFTGNGVDPMDIVRAVSDGNGVAPGLCRIQPQHDLPRLPTLDHGTFQASSLERF